MISNATYMEDLRVSSSSLDWGDLEGKTVAIIGSTGSIGETLVDLIMYHDLHEGGSVRVIATYRNEGKARSKFSPFLNDERFGMIQYSIPDTIPGSIDADFIVNCASNTHPLEYANDPIGTIMVNIEGTMKILQHLSEQGHGRYVMLSTVEIYGENRGDAPAFDEAYCGYIDPNTVRAGYPESKRVCESLCNAYNRSNGVDFTILRLSRVFGPTVEQDDSKAMTQFIRNGVNGEDIVLKSDGMQCFSYTYVVDCVSAIVLSMTHCRSGEAYNVSNDSMRLRDIVENIASVSGVGIEYRLPSDNEKAGASMVKNAVMDNSKMLSLGWVPKTNIPDGIRKTLDILKNRTRDD